MRYRQSERLPEERGHRKPIGEPADEGGFGGCANEQDPETRLGCQGGRNEQRRHHPEQRRRNQAISTKAASLKILRAYRHADGTRSTEDPLNIDCAPYHLHYAIGGINGPD